MAVINVTFLCNFRYVNFRYMNNYVDIENLFSLNCVSYFYKHTQSKSTILQSVVDMKKQALK